MPKVSHELGVTISRGILVYMNSTSRAATAAIAVLAILLPSFAFAFPFGGQISVAVPCYNQAIFARIGAPRGGDYIWTPSTKTYQFGPPSFSGQWLLGLASAPYYCIVTIEPLVVWTGIAIDMMGSSGSPAPTINQLLTPGGGSSGGGGASGSWESTPAPGSADLPTYCQTRKTLPFDAANDPCDNKNLTCAQLNYLGYKKHSTLHVAVCFNRAPAKRR